MSGVAAIWSGALALAASALALTRPNAVHALLWLLAALLALAACFLTLGAGFAGALQIAIYAGAVIVVFVFAMATTPLDAAAVARERARLGAAWRGPAALAALAAAPFAAGAPGWSGGADAAPVSAAEIGALLFGPWAAAVELASALLLAGLLGARHLGRRDRSGGDAR